MIVDLEPRTLAGTNLRIGRVVFGAMTFGSQVDEADALAMVERCREAGITMFDTSNNYNGGKSEEMLGRSSPPSATRSSSRPRSAATSVRPTHLAPA